MLVIQAFDSVIMRQKSDLISDTSSKSELGMCGSNEVL